MNRELILKEELRQDVEKLKQLLRDEIISLKQEIKDKELELYDLMDKLDNEEDCL